MTISRRNILTIMGLSAGAGIAAEDAFTENDLALRKPVGGRLLIGRDAKGTKIAAALRKLATEIENCGIDILSLDVSTAVNADEIVRQRLTLDFLINDVVA